MILGISWKDKVSNKKVMIRVQTELQTELHFTKDMIKRKFEYAGHVLRGSSGLSHISFIHILIGQPTFFFPSTLPSSIYRCDKPLEPLSTCPAYSNFLFIISFVKCNSVCNSVYTRIMTFLSIPYTLHVLFSLSIIFCIFFLLSATKTASSAYLRSVILIPLNLIPSTFSMASFIINSLHRLKSICDITQPCPTPLSTPTSLLTSPSHLTAPCCPQ